MSAHTISLPLGGHSRAIVKSLLLEGPQSRTALANRLEMSAGSITRLTKPLLESGLISETQNSEATSGLGRPSVPLSFNHTQSRFIGIKLTSTHAYAALTQADARIESLVSKELESNDVQASVNVITSLVKELKAQSTVSVRAIGVTLGGHVQDYNLVTHADHLGWDQVPLASLIEEATGITTIVENDIVAHTEATHWFGEGVGTQTFALVTLGAGIGYGLITHGQVVTSHEAGYSLLSHHPVSSIKLDEYAEELARFCGVDAKEIFRAECNHEACASAMLTLGQLQRRATKVLGRSVSFDQLLGLAQAGDPTARVLVDASGYALGTIFAAIANLTMPQRIVVGGEAVQLAEVAHTAMLAGLHDNRDSRTTDPELRFQDPNLALWTKGAAVVAMHNTLVGR